MLTEVATDRLTMGEVAPFPRQGTQACVRVEKATWALTCIGSLLSAPDWIECTSSLRFPMP